MNEQRSSSGSSYKSASGVTDRFHKLSHDIFQYANINISRAELLNEITKILYEFFDCEEVEIWMKESNDYQRYEVAWQSDSKYRFNVIHDYDIKKKKTDLDYHNDKGIINLSISLFEGDLDPFLSCFTENNSFWESDLKNPLILTNVEGNENIVFKFNPSFDYKTIVIVPFLLGEERVGLLHLHSKKAYFFSGTEVKLIEDFAKILGIVLLNQYRHTALQERVKELTCLYNMSRITDTPDVTLEEIIYNTIEFLPPAWQYPEITIPRIVLDDKEYMIENFEDSKYIMSADIIIDNNKRGFIEVGYTEEMPELDEGPFLTEERDLIETVAKELSLIIERKENEEEKNRLQDQLRHADRMATVGELSAGVAHELNEPLGSILGFAQLLERSGNLSKKSKNDLEKIIKSALHAREVVKKLMFFARQLPPQKDAVNLNKLIEDGLYFLDARCEKEGIEVIREYRPDLPDIIADHVQLNQVVVNLVVNAIQAMPEGGRLILKTDSMKDYVVFLVEDTGTGMNKETVKQIFTPFFTTKEIGKGTGLGLSVVHGIITSHGGTINVNSKPGKGTVFEVHLPLYNIDSK